MSESRYGYGNTGESRDFYSSHESSKNTRDEISSIGIENAIKKHNQDIANQIKQLKSNLITKSELLQKQLKTTEDEILRLQNIEKLIN